VLGTGLMRKCIYPAEHRYFYDKFLENPNVVFLTEYPPNTIAAKQNFPARNRIISGLSLGVLVVQAGKKSGALITAEMALEQNREVFAIPDRIGSINSFGTNELIKLGKAKLTQSVDDILDELRPDYSEFNTVEQVSIATKKLKLSEFEEKVLNTLTPLPRKLSDLADALDMPEHNLAAVLTKLELKNLVRQLPGHLYCIK